MNQVFAAPSQCLCDRTTCMSVADSNGYLFTSHIITHSNKLYYTSIPYQYKAPPQKNTRKAADWCCLYVFCDRYHNANNGSPGIRGGSLECYLSVPAFFLTFCPRRARIRTKDGGALDPTKLSSKLPNRMDLFPPAPH